MSQEAEENATVNDTIKDEEIDANIDTVLEDKWLIRESRVYEDEYDECTSFRARFHQYFIYGHTIDCNQWKKDYENSRKWEKDKDVKAAQAVINSERARRMERLLAHYRNDTWKKRDAPPKDWDKPLPDWMAKRLENTYLAHRAQEMKEGKLEEPTKGFCSIM